VLLDHLHRARCVVHRDRIAAGDDIEAVSGGWPKVLSNLKSLLETGDVAFQK
jgi:hypothetical protein